MRFSISRFASVSLARPRRAYLVGFWFVLTAFIVWYFLFPLNLLHTLQAPRLQRLQQQKYELQEATLLARLEQKRLETLDWADTDYQRAERFIGMPEGALPRSTSEYFGRLEDLSKKWFGNTASYQAILKSLDKHRRRDLDHVEAVRQTLFTMNKGGRSTLPEEFGQWDRMLGAGDLPEGAATWAVEVMNNEGDMDGAIRRHSDILPRDGEDHEDTTGTYSPRPLQDLWNQLDFAVLKTDLLRYLGLMFEGGCYADSDTQPLAHPTRWGSMSTDLRSHSDELLQELADLRRQHRSGSLVKDDHAIRDTRFRDIAHRNTILDPGVSVVLSLDSNTVQSHLEGGISDPAVDTPWVGYPGVAYRRCEFCQWTLLAKRLHPLFIDAAVTTLENVDRALANRKLDGSIPVCQLTGPAPFTDAVIRYLLIQHGLDPISFIKLQAGQPPDNVPSMRVGDMILYRAHSFGVQAFQPEYVDIGVKENIRRPVAHDYSGSWKGQGWD